jgi:hypothetical protein
MMTAVNNRQKKNFTSWMAVAGCFVAFTSAGVYTYGMHRRTADDENEEPHNFSYFFSFFSSAMFMTYYQAYWIVYFLGWCASYHAVGTVVLVQQEIGSQYQYSRIEYRAAAVDDDDDEKVPGGLMDKKEDSGASVCYTFGWSQKLIRSWRDGDPIPWQKLIRSWREGDPIPCLLPNGAAADGGQATLKVIDLLVVRGYPESARPCCRCAGMFWCPVYIQPVYCVCCSPLSWNCFVSYLVQLILYLYPYPLEPLHLVMIIGSCLWIWPSTLYNHPIKVSDAVDDSYVPMTNAADADDENPAVHSTTIGTTAAGATV